MCAGVLRRGMQRAQALRMQRRTLALLIALSPLANGCQGVLLGAEEEHGAPLPIAGPATLPEMIRRAPSVDACSTLGFDRIENCLNYGLPLEPSIHRSSVRPRGAETSAPTVPYGPHPSGTAPQTFVLPTHRTSADGRIATDGVGLAMFYPENLHYGFQTRPGRSVLGRTLGLGEDVRIDGRPGRTRYPAAYFLGEHGASLNTAENWEICSGRDPNMGSGSDSNAGRNLRTCIAPDPDAPYNPSQPTAHAIHGECYDANLIFVVNGNPGSSGLGERVEIRSIALTFFFGGASQPSLRGAVRVPETSAPSQAIFLYPTGDLTRAEGEILPWHRNYDIPPPNAGTPQWSIRHYYEAALARCDGATTQPAWCHFLDQQHVLPVDQRYVIHRSPTSSHTWDGVRNSEPNAHGEYDAFHAFLEPATTGDGRVLIVHDYHQGILYSYNEVGPCDAAGFSDFRPISMAYLDPRVNQRYGFARYPVRRTNGEVVPPGETVDGGYPWIDRHGNNLMFPAVGGQNGFVGHWVPNPGESDWTVRLPNDDGSFTPDPDPEVEAFMNVPGETVETESWNVNNGNGTGVVVLGSWTRGKMILVDNGLYESDWTFSTYSSGFRDHRFAVPLFVDNETFETEDTLVRPAGVAFVNSFENIMNQYNVMNPISPFDVVWTASSTQERNTEIVFDEYMRRGMRVVAHMNADITLYPNPSHDDGEVRRNPLMQQVNNGFVPQAGALHLFSHSPVLQNATTTESPETGGIATLRLLGGSWLPPVAEGGVQGRGVWLDGANDHVLIERLPASLRRFYLGLWVDLRAWDARASMTLYRFGNGTAIDLRQGAIRVVRPGTTSQELALDAAAMENARYFHLGLGFDDGPGGPRMVVFLDGQRVGTLAIGQTPRFVPATAPPSATGTLTIGTNEYRALRGGGYVYPVRGWVDEFRMMDLQPGELESTTFTEHACNLALGSARRLGTSIVCEQIDFRHNDTTDAEGVGASLDFPLEAYQTRNCGNSVHQNAGALGCARGELLSLADRQLVASQHRPDFSDVAFCTTCHTDAMDAVPGLRPAALLPYPLDPTTGVPNMSATALTDPRRQPMQWLRRMDGRAPRRDTGASQLFDPSHFNAAWLHGQLDPQILGGTNSTQPTRLGPY